MEEGSSLDRNALIILAFVGAHNSNPEGDQLAKRYEGEYLGNPVIELHVGEYYLVRDAIRFLQAMEQTTDCDNYGAKCGK